MLTGRPGEISDYKLNIEASVTGESVRTQHEVWLCLLMSSLTDTQLVSQGASREAGECGIKTSSPKWNHERARKSEDTVLWNHLNLDGRETTLSEGEMLREMLVHSSASKREYILERTRVCGWGQEERGKQTGGWSCTVISMRIETLLL